MATLFMELNPCFVESLKIFPKVTLCLKQLNITFLVFLLGYAAYDFLDYLWQPNRKNDISNVGILIHHLFVSILLMLIHP